MFSPAYKVGDRVEALDTTWYKGAVTQTGDGKNVGYYLEKYEDFSTRRYYKAANLRISLLTTLPISQFPSPTDLSFRYSA